MNFCPNCGIRLNGDLRFCPNCGASVQLYTAVPAYATPYAVQVPVKKRHTGVIVAVAVILVIAFVAAGIFLYSKALEARAYNQFMELYDTMVEGGEKAEDANLLILNVWRNSIYKTSDKETDKYTRADRGNGAFYDDFNDALKNLFDDKSFQKDQDKIYDLQKKAEALMKELSDHPKSFDDQYYDFKDCYRLFFRFTNMALTGEGSLNSFTEEYNKIDKELADSLWELKMYFD